MVTARKKRGMKRASNFVAILVTLSLVMMQTPVTYGFGASDSGSGSASQQAYTLNVGLSFDHAYIEYDGQVVAEPATMMTVPAGDDIEFSAEADNGYVLDSVVAYVNGSKMELDPEEGVYSIGAAEVGDKVNISVAAVPEEEEAELEAAAADNKAAASDDEGTTSRQDETGTTTETATDSDSTESGDATADAEKEDVGTTVVDSGTTVVDEGTTVVDEGTTVVDADKEKADSEKDSTTATDADKEKADSDKDSKSTTDADKDKVEAEKNTQTKYVYTDDDVTVTATLSNPEAVPANAKFEVTPVTPQTKGYNYDAYMEALNNSKDGFDYNASNTFMYDVAFMVPKTDDEGNEIEGEWVEVQLEEGWVDLDFKFEQNQLSEAVEAAEMAPAVESVDVEVNHLPLKDSVRADVETTAAAENITANDIIVESPKTSDVDAAANDMTLSLDSLSIVTLTVTGTIGDDEGSGSSENQADYTVKVNATKANVEALAGANYYLLVEAEGGAYGFAPVDLSAQASNSYAFNVFKKADGTEVKYEAEKTTITSVKLYRATGNVDGPQGLLNGEAEELSGSQYGNRTTVTATSSAAVATIEALPYVVKLDYSEADVDALTGSFYVLVQTTKDGVVYYGYASRPLDDSANTFTVFTSLDGQELRYSSDLQVTVQLVHSSNASLDMEEAIYGVGSTAYESEQQLGNNQLQITSQENVSVLKLIGLVGVQPVDHMANVQFYQTDKVTPLTSLRDYPIEGKIVAVARLTPAGTGPKGQTVAWQIVDVNVANLNNSGSTSIRFTGSGFKGCDAQLEPNGWMVNFNPSAYDINVMLYTVGDGVDAASATYNQVAIEENRTIPGYKFLANTLSDDKTTSNISLSIDSSVQLAIELNFDGIGNIANNDKAYVFVKLQHQSSQDTYFMQRVTVDGEQQVTIYPDKWVDQNNQAVSSTYTGQEKAVSVQLIIPVNDSLQLSEAKDGNNCQVLKSGDGFGHYAVFYGDMRNDGGTHTYPINFKDIYVPAEDGLDYTQVLGNARYFGIVADEWDQYESETNAAVKKVYAHQQSGNDLVAYADGSHNQMWFVGQVASGELHIKGDAADVYAPSSQQSKIKNQTVGELTFHEMSQDSVNAYIDGMKAYISSMSSTLASRNSLAQGVSAINMVKNQKLELDLTSFGPGTIYISLDDKVYDPQTRSYTTILDYISSQADKLHLTKRSDQFVVFSSNTTNDVYLLQFTLKNDDSTANSSSIIGGRSTMYDEMASTIVWNFPNATKVSYGQRGNGSVAGIFLAPKADVTIHDTGCGWTICKKFTNTGDKEWHSIWQRYDQDYSRTAARISAHKRLDNRIPGNKTFTFELTEDGTGKTWTATSNAAGYINFPEIVYDTVGTYTYKIKEVAGNEEGISYDTNVHTAKVVVSEVSADGIVATVTYDNDQVLSPTFSNTTNASTGDLRVSKTVVTPFETDNALSFKVIVSLSDKTINGTYGDITFHDGVAEVTLKHGETATAKGLPKGIGYTVVETSASTQGFNKVVSNAAGTIKAGSTNVAITNTRNVGSLKIKKIITENGAAPSAIANKLAAGVYTFDIYTDAACETPYKVDNNPVSVSVTIPEDKSFAMSEEIVGMPAGVYWVKERAVENGTKPVANPVPVTIEAGKMGEAAVIRDLTNNLRTGSLEVKKQVESDIEADKDIAFEFTVTLKNGEANADINGEYGGMSFEDGVATFKLKHGESKKATSLPVGLNYTVVEAYDDSFSSKEEKKVSGDTVVITFKNTRKTGGLKITKNFTENGSATLSDTAKSLAAGNYVFGVYTDEACENPYKEDETAKTVTVTVGDDGQSATSEEVANMPAGDYWVKELETPNASVAPNNAPVKVTVAAGKTGEQAAVATVTNTITTTGGLTVSKALVSGATADADQTFAFTVKLSDTTINGTYGANAETGAQGMTFTNGEATFYLKGGQSVTATGLPTGIGYKVTESAVDGFTADKDEATGTIEAGEDKVKTASFTNTRDTGKLKVSKKFASSNTLADPDAEFSFTVALTLGGQPLSGTFGADEEAGKEGTTFTNGEATFVLKAGEYKLIEGLPAGAQYTVAESPANDYAQASATGNNGSIGKNTTAEAAFENARKTGELVISKTVVSPIPAEQGAAYTFTVELKNGETPVGGTFGGVTFGEDGKATVTVNGGGSTTISGLPVGVTYTVNEVGADNFNTAPENATGTISTNKATAVFVNTRKTGDLEVKKTVTSSTASDKEKKFAFTVTLGDTSINGTFGEMAFTDGVASFELTDGQSLKAEGLPIGVSYTISESDASSTGFVVTNGAKQGAIQAGAATVEVANAKVEGGLTVEKVVSSALISDNDIEFGFKVTLGDTSINGTYGDENGMTFTNGIAEFTLKAGQSKTATGLPDGVEYTVEETGNGWFDTQSSGHEGTVSASPESAAKATFTNTRKTGELDISKTVVSDVTADASQVFAFSVELTGEGADAVTGKYSGVDFVNGKATVEITGTGTKAITGLPAGLGYKVAEVNIPANFEQTASSGDEGTIEAGDDKAKTASFTNTRKTGELDISKDVVSDVPADASQVFAFSVELTGEGADAVTGKYSGVDFVNGKATVEITGTGTKAITGLPTGLGYKVTEAAVANFTQTGASNATGTISSTKSTASFTNTRDTGKLKVSKKFASSNTLADPDAEFSFTVALTLGGQPLSGTFGADEEAGKEGTTFTNGEATFVLKAGEYKLIEGLPAGAQYMVAESPANDYAQESATGDNGSIGKNTTAEAAFENARKTGELVISKSVVSPIQAEQGAAYTFTVELKNGETPVGGTFGGVTFGEDGKATVTVNGGGSTTISGLPVGVTYTVNEVGADNFNTAPENATGTISTNKATAVFVNTRKTGELEISKSVISPIPAEETQAFDFTVRLQLGDTPVSGTFGEVEFNALGEATVTINGGSSKVISGIPAGVTYTVVEAPYAYFNQTEAQPQTGAIVAGEKATTLFKNTRNTGELKVTKTVTSSTESDKTKEFDFTVELKLNDQPFSGTFDGVTFGNDGKGTFKLKDGEYKVITGLPTGVEYTVTETNANGFAITKTGYEGEITSTQAVAAFTNTRDEGGLLVSKEVESAIDADKEREFSFEVTLDDTTVNGTYGGMTFTNGKANFTLKNGETKSATGLAQGIGYTVTEATAANFKTTKTGDTGTIGATVSEAKFKNTRETGGLELSKAVVSDANADKSKEFTFTVRLSDNTIAGTFGDMTFEAGKATVTLKDGESKKAAKLPADITYTVTETPVNGLTASPTIATGTVTANTTAQATFTNTREKGDLTVRKAVESDASADHSKKFAFTVTLSDATISGTYGGMTFTDGVATVELADNESATAAGLPTGIGYKVAEGNHDGFTVDPESATGTISTTASDVTLTNTREKGDLTVRKAVESDASADHSKKFAFTVTLSDATISGTYGGMTFTDGVATVELADTESATAAGLPTDITYKVAEGNHDGFTVDPESATGTISTTASDVTLTNTREKGDLTVRKAVESDASADHSKKFAFTVTLSDTTINGTYGANAETGAQGMTFTDGVATVELADNESATAAGLPTGIGYKVAEGNHDGFTVDPESATGTISTTASDVTFTNTRETGDLTVSKALVSGATADADQTFAFTVKLSDTTINGTYGANAETGAQGMTFTNGEATFYLKGGQSVTATGLPTGITYTVAETENADFTTTSENASGPIAAGGKTATFTNTRKTGNLMVTKTVASSTAADMQRDFRFTVTLEGAPISGPYGGMTFTEGVAEFTLKHGQDITATGLPTGVRYTVAEETDNGFATTKTGETGTISEQLSTAAFTNTKLEGGLVVSKNVVGDVPADSTQEFEFTVTLTDTTVNGVYGEMSFTHGVATFTLHHGQTKTAEGLARGIEYTVTEEEVENLTTTKTSDTGTIGETPRAAEFTNTRDTGNMKISKVLVSDAAADANQKFEFAVELSDETINKVYSGVQFTDGKATVEITGAGEKVIEGLPAGIGYTVTETANEDFTTTPQNASDTITTEGKTAEFTNTRKTGNLVLSKALVSDAAADADQEFTFTVTLDGVQKNEANPVVKTYSGVEFTNGVATVTLKGGESKTIEGLPTGVGYKVEEAAIDGEPFTVEKAGDTGKIEAGEDKAKTAEFTNTRKTGDLIVSKALVSDAAADKDAEFEFTVTLTGLKVAEQDETVTYGDMTFNKDGVATFKLKDGESKTATGLPTGIGYKVEEAAIEGEPFTVGKVGDAGTITTTESKADFTNTRKTGNLVLSKALVSDAAADANQEFEFTVTLDGVQKDEANPVVKTYSGVEFTNGVANVKLKGGESKAIEGLPTGVGYTVTEKSDNRFAVTKTGDTGTITTTPSAAAFTNTRLAHAKFEFNKYHFGGQGTFDFTLVATDANGTARTGEAIATDGAAIVDNGTGSLTLKKQNGAYENGVAKVEFPEISYAADGDYYYLVSEEVPSDSSMMADEAQYLVHVPVANGKADEKAITYELIYNGQNLGATTDTTFYNNSTVKLGFASLAAMGYTTMAEKVSVYPQVQKRLNGITDTMVGDEFQFELVDKATGGVVARGTNDESGNVAFFDEASDGLVYVEPGVYEYLIREVKGSDASITYDTTEIDLTVQVEQTDNGLVANTIYSGYEPQGDDDQPTFYNFTEGMDVTVQKVSRYGGEGLVDCTYALWMKGDNGDVMIKEATSDANGYITFTDVHLIKGQRYYFKEVEAPAGHTVDPYRTAYFALNDAGDSLVIVEQTAADGWHSATENIESDKA